ncbi:hypothetical protein [Corynebacterium glutamicum]|uniref:Uncharacterized protein n=2 Tax=Corynebacterium glutamicum TaxID=1718 RepID=Q5KRJ0_CORGT|nr:hypothetical protein [Corynebacterium glutamicum]BAD84091.1 hypothetical protein [Corynebacterium glutamicum]BAF54883.1 hypothetical protein cgR_1888 [Corynebacterium glutamicum R]
MAEVIVVHGAAGGVDDDGYPIPGKADESHSVKSVQPLSLEEISEDDRQGVKDALRVWGNSGLKVSPGDHVTVRGFKYRVVKTAWDWSKNRRPANPRHRPGTVFDCVRGVG